MEDSKTKPHKQKELIIKSAKIDEGIYDFVKWLNGFLSVETEFSCEGLSGEEIKTHKNSDTYKESCFYMNITSDRCFYAEVDFFCEDTYHLKIILNCIQSFKRQNLNNGLIETSVSYDKKNDKLHYHIIFEKKESPSQIVKFYHEVFKKVFIERKLKFIP